MPDFDKIEIKFQGGQADLGRLHFYEYGRSQYALARLVSTVEVFRRTGRVPERITGSNYIDIYVDTPKRGSFVNEIIMPIFTGAGGNLLSIPFSSIFKYTFDTLLPKATENRISDEAIKRISEIRIKELERDTRRDQESTEQIRILADVIKGEQDNAKATLAVLESAMQSKDTIIHEMLSEIKNLNEIKAQVQYDAERETNLSKIETDLSKIDTDQLRRLTSRVRPMISEIGLPLRRSADSLSISENNEDGKIVRLDSYRIGLIEKRDLQDESVTISCVIRMYDKISGTGKIRSEYFVRDLNFKVPSNMRSKYLPLITDAMKKSSVVCTFDVFEDESGMPTSLILVNIEGD